MHLKTNIGVVKFLGSISKVINAIYKNNQLNIFDRNLIKESMPPFSVLLSNVLFSILTNWIYVPIAKKMNRTIKTEVKIIMSKSSILLFSFNI